ncbi:MAG TPA: ATP-binding protein [Bacillota bacterium]|nr:ATP-binding protein [Bacillota bacterium]
MFKSARVKLTLFYLAILLVFSFTLTFTFRILFEHEFGRSNTMERGEVKQIFMRGVYVLAPDQTPGYSAFNDFQDSQASVVRQRLNNDLVIINIAALAIGGVISYWFAGRTLQPIEKAHRDQARFAADASHELRTPLTNIKLENEVFLRQKTFSEAEAREQIASNLEEVQRLEGLSTNLLALTQYGNTTLAVKSLPVKRVVQDAVKQSERVAHDRGVTVETNVTAATILGHHESLVQLLVILIDNAIKYGPEKGTVGIGGQAEDGHYLLWVEDQGPGIPEADMPRIFDRLYRGDKARSSKVGGYGLGLSLAQAIATANGAELRAENLPEGKGAVFIARLSSVKQ